ncbi:Putative transposable element [Caligus rogercresseyi]|uniref:Transposable element n=1 Tax=Caligus rogercresseyi TaxID=217165 RepID=A0A7T8KJW1_CALRO|nr:Putative transposable element [Caligus rogercresseyi]
MEAFRKKIAERIEAGDKLKDIAMRFSINVKTVYKVRDMMNNGDTSQRHSNLSKIEETRALIAQDPSTSIRMLSRDVEVPEKTERALEGGLGSESLAKTRVDRCRKIKNFIKNDLKGRIIVFSDEKTFSVDKYTNRRNDRYISTSTKSADPEISDDARLRGLNGKAFPPIWFDGSVNATTGHYGHNGYIWTQDGAPAHTSKAIQKYLENKLGSKGFWSKEMWPPSSPNLNPLDFSIWQHIENKACGVYHSNISDLKATVNDVWAAMDETYIRKSCSDFRSASTSALMLKGPFSRNEL